VRIYTLEETGAALESTPVVERAANDPVFNAIWSSSPSSKAIPSWLANCTMILVGCAALQLLAFIEQQKASGP
jgi:hypothetical protein